MSTIIPTRGDILRIILLGWNLRSDVRTLPPKPRSAWQTPFGKAVGTESMTIDAEVGSTWGNSDGANLAILLNHGAYL